MHGSGSKLSANPGRLLGVRAGGVRRLPSSSSVIGVDGLPLESKLLGPLQMADSEEEGGLG